MLKIDNGVEFTHAEIFIAVDSLNALKKQAEAFKHIMSVEAWNYAKFSELVGYCDKQLEVLKLKLIEIKATNEN
jgi:hypothetical protein